MESIILNPEHLEHAANMMKAMSHPMRIAILRYLEDGSQLSVTQIHELLKIEQSTTSHHLGILKDKDVLSSRREGKHTYYYIRHENVRKIMECVRECYS